MAAHFGNSALMGVASLSLCRHRLRRIRPNCSGSCTWGPFRRNGRPFPVPPVRLRTGARSPSAETHAPTARRGSPRSRAGLRRRPSCAAAPRRMGRLGLPGTEHLTDRLADDAVRRRQRTRHQRRRARRHRRRARRAGWRARGPAALVVEVLRPPPLARPARRRAPSRRTSTPEYGRGLRLRRRARRVLGHHLPHRRQDRVGAAARRGARGRPGTTRGVRGGARAASAGCAPPRSSRPSPSAPSATRDWLSRGALSFLAEASDLLAGQLDEDLVAALAGQLIVPRLADWCAVWLEDEVAGRWAAGG